MQYFSVAYRPLTWPLPRFMEAISVGPCGAEVTDLGEQYPEWIGQDPFLGEYAALFALRRRLQAGDAGADDEMVGISHYRRFAVTLPTTVSSRRGEAIKPAAFSSLPPERFLPPPGVILHAQPIKVQPSLVSQYNRYHHTRDLLFFMAVAVDLGIITDTAAAGWLGGNVLVPAATVGVFPRGWWTDTMIGLEEVVGVFRERHGRQREGYQRRTLAFCLERLHSFLLVKLVLSWDPDLVRAHPELIVDPAGRYVGNDGSR